MNLEERIESLREKGDLRGAATEAFEGYGPEILGFLVTVLRDESDAQEVFSQTCLDMWGGLGKFEGRCTMRTWLYTLARHAAARLRRSPHRRREHNVALSAASEVAERVRSRTMAHLRTSVKDQFAVIRDSLSEQDRALLILKVDRGMKWREIARIYTDDDSDDALRRVEAKLRKRFEVVTKRVRVRAQEAGLLPPERES